MKLLNALNALSVNKETAAPDSLKTPWTDRVNPGHVWEEYPRPQMVRDSYINLNGLWHYAIRGISAPGPRGSWDGKILVPFSPESMLSGVMRQLKPGQVLHYGRRFTLPRIPKARRLLLHFGAVDERCRVCVNGHEAGRHQGGYLPFTFDITALVHPGHNTLTVSCLDDSDTGCHTRGKQMLKRGGIFYTAQSGIWQTVWMEWVPDIYVENIRLTPEYDRGRLHCRITLNQPSPDVLFHVTASAEGETVAELSAVSSDFSLDIPDFLPWTPETPYLYDLKIELCLPDKAQKRTVTDCVASYFAMRCFSVERDAEGIARLCLNHVPYFHNGVLDQGYWPDGLYTAPCDEAFIHDILTMKKAGFNMLRKHCKLEPLRWYYHCDRLGMLVWQDIPNGGSSYDMLRVCYLPTLIPSRGIRDRELPAATGRTSPAGRQEWYRQTRETIAHLYSCPCIASWVLFNEGWGQFDTARATDFVRGLDPTRTLDQASGWFDHRGGDMRSVHNYFRRLTCPERNTPCLDRAGTRPEDTPSPNRCGMRAAVISEYGGLALPMSGHTATGQSFGYRSLTSQEDFRERFSALLSQICHLAGQGLSAAVYTQVSDIEDEVNGILTYDRIINKLD